MSVASIERSVATDNPVLRVIDSCMGCNRLSYTLFCDLCVSSYQQANKNTAQRHNGQPIALNRAGRDRQSMASVAYHGSARLDV